MIRSIAAELLVIRKRTATWVLLGIWAALTVMFGYVLAFADYRGQSGAQRQQSLAEIVPHGIVGNVLGGFPFFGGVLVLILGVLTLGSDYGWGTLKTLFTQGPGRLRLFGAKLIALGVALVPFVVASFASAAVASALIANRESAAIDWPGIGLLLRGMAAAWLILAVWAMLGVMLAVISRGTALAIGIGILYGLVIEGLISRLLDQVDVIRPLIKVLLRANGYSLVATLGASTADARSNGPGAFDGPYVGGAQSLLVLALDLAIFAAIAAALIRRRDVA
jgi:ABC-2 type transport system permease protein